MVLAVKTDTLQSEARRLAGSNVADVDLTKELVLLDELAAAGGGRMGPEAARAARDVREQLRAGHRFVSLPASHARELRVEVLRIRRSNL